MSQAHRSRPEGGGGSPYNGLYGEAPYDRGTRLEYDTIR